MPAPSGEKLKGDRLANLEEIRKRGVDPFGSRFPDAIPVEKARLAFAGGPPEVTVRCAGRIRQIRDHGKSKFLDIQDWTAKIQIHLKKGTLPDQQFELAAFLDLGDVVGVTGKLFKTKTGEITVSVEDMKILTKSVSPWPEKWHGLQDVEIRHRRRYLDLASGGEALGIFMKRSAIVRSIRRFLDDRGFLEVETPMMQPIPGGANARPFVTRHNALGIDLFLRVAPELYLKRLLVGGMERIYEINRNFRNEGISARHNPEFTMLEAYQAYADYGDMMDLTEGLITRLAEEATGNLRVPGPDGAEISLAGPWPRVPYRALFEKFAALPFGDREAILAKAKELGLEAPPDLPFEAIRNEVFEHAVEPNLVSPTFVIDYPTAICPLAKAKASDPETAERFELFIAGMEIANAFTELNDPAVQRRRFEDQIAHAREKELRVLDEDFILALEHGMPPAGGLGIGIDRLVMVLTGRQTIREVILFPLLRPR